MCMCTHLCVGLRVCEIEFVAIFKSSDSEAERSFLSSLLQLPKVNFRSDRKMQVNTNASAPAFPPTLI